MSDRPTLCPVIIEYHDGKYDGSALFHAGWYHIIINSKLLKSGEPSNMPFYGALKDKYEITPENYEALARGESTLVCFDFGEASYFVRRTSYYKKGDGLSQGGLFRESDDDSATEQGK
jgi:hypothetical protein